MVLNECSTVFTVSPLTNNLAVFQMNEVLLGLILVPSKRRSKSQDALCIDYGQLSVGQVLVGRVDTSCSDTAPCKLNSCS